MTLNDDGYVVIKSWCSDDLKKLKNIREALDKECSGFQEYVKHESGQQYVLGGFSAFANPSSFHNPTVRTLREWCMSSVIHVMKGQITNKQTKLEQIIDRMMIRRQGLNPSKESWHRDEAPSIKKGDIVFGGWINLDSTPQYFSCIPRSHKVNTSGGGGFVKIDAKTLKTLNKTLNNQKSSIKTNMTNEKVEIGPGDIIIFNENILHEVLPNKSKNDMYRLFLGWRLTKYTTPLIEDLEKKLAFQAVMPLKSNQIPPMYAKLHWTNHIQKLVTFSTVMHPKCLEIKKMKSGKHKDKEFRVVKRYLPSLHEMEFTLYSEYTNRETNMYYPSNSWNLYIPGKFRRKQYTLYSN